MGQLQEPVEGIPVAVAHLVHARLLEPLARPGDGVTLIMQELFDRQDEINVPLPIEALSGAAFGRRQLGELRLPRS